MKKILSVIGAFAGYTSGMIIFSIFSAIHKIYEILSFGFGFSKIILSYAQNTKTRD